MRRALVLGLAFACAAPAVRAQSIVAGPVATQITAGVGERITIPVAVNMTGASGIDLGSYRARFRWNPALTRLVSVTGGTFPAPAVNADSAPQGVVRFAAAAAQGVSGVPVLADITLEVLSLAAADTFRLTFAEMNAARTFQDLLPFLSVTSGSFCAGSVWGDLDGNGIVQALDAQIALMHAVGMAVSDTSYGDVDADGVVGTRDALVILSDVVGLDVTAFRVGTLVSGLCQTGDPATVNVFPASVTLAAGDTFRVTAQVRDSAGNLAPGLQLAWSSSDPTRATVDSLGVVRALVDGAVTLTASVSPMLTGTGSVTVGPRHRWRVDPAGAQGALGELGSDAYPFSTIARAVTHAAAGDTVSVAVARYAEPLAAAKPLVFVGDSGSSGMPVISTPNQAAGQLAAAGRHVVRRFQVDESQAGLLVAGDTLDLESLWLRSLRGPGVRAVVTGRATVLGVIVEGAAGAGVVVDSAGVVRFARVRISGVQANDSTGGVGLFARADSVFVDTVTVTGVGGTGILTRDAERTRVRRARVEYVWDGIRADSGTTLEVLDSTAVRHVAAGGGIGGDVDSLRVTDAVVEDVAGPGVWIGFVWFTYDQMRVERTRIERVGAAVTAASFGQSATLRHLTVREVAGDALRPYAAAVRMDTVLLERVGGDGLLAVSATSLDVTGSTLRAVRGAGIETTGGTGRARIEGTRLESMGGSALYIGNDTLELAGDTIIGTDGYGVYHTYGQRLVARDLLVRRTGSAGIYVYNTLLVDIRRSRVDTAGTQFNARGIDVYYADSALIDSSEVVGARDMGVHVGYSGFARVQSSVVDGNFRLASPLGGFKTPGAVTFTYVDTALVRNNLMRQNGAQAVHAYVTSGGTWLRVDSNTVRGAWGGVVASGFDSLTGRVEVVDNAFTGRLDGNPTRQVWVESMGHLLVSGNTMDSIVGHGVYHFFGDSLHARMNTITNQRDNGGGYYGIGPSRVGAAAVDSNSIACTGASASTGIFFHRTSGSLTGNTIGGCARGVTAFNDYTLTPESVTATGNRVTGGTVTIGGFVARGLVHATFADNVVTGGVLSDGAFAGIGTNSLRVPKVTVTGDSVQGGAGRGIVMRWVDTVDIGGNDVTGLASLYADTTSEAGIWLRNVFGPAFVHGNSVRNGADAGMLLTDTTRAVRLDTNLVVDHLGSGIVLRSLRASGAGVSDTVRGTLNGIRRNQPYGVWVGEVNALLPANDIVGNLFGVFNDDADTVDVRNTWWADALGPTCDVTLELCDPSSVGDSVGGYNLGLRFVFLPFASGSVTGTPAGSPPAFTATSSAIFAAPSSLRRARIVPVEPAPTPPLREEPPPPPVRPVPVRGEP